ncbi:hypothetical protein GX586_14335, partial [bacterium]|nr:hypothetical protein [bacterium]
MPRKTKHAATRSRTSLWFAPSEPSHVIRPLERISVAVSRPCTIAVTDGGGNEYHRGAAGPEAAFIVGGALGMHTVTAYGSDGRKAATLSFAVDARTEIDDDRGVYKEFLRILHKTMCCYSPTGDIAFEWRGRTYRYFVHWILDHGHTAKGMQFFSPHTAGLVDLLRDVQREDGMIWSNVNKDTGPGWYDTCYGPYGYARRTKGLLLVRQPVENHCEYNFVDAAWRAWKGSGDDAWMKRVLKACTKALDYTVNDRARWSGRFGLLKRGYCIDSWDFQAHDEYEPEFAVPSAMLIDPDRTKFGVFYGDNTGYTFACEQLAEMLEHAGRKKEAARFRLRAAEMHKRLNDIAWNGRFYTHHVEEDPAVKRNFGVDEKSQISFSNAYSLNRNITDEQCKAIIGTYRDLLAHLPPGSPGEWYAIYPPFERGFGKENAKWQYMNGGVHGHAAGELSLGAFEHGYERYGADILERMYRLGKKHGGKIYFAYTGAYPPPPPPQRFAPVDLSALANMDITDAGSDTARRWMDDRAGNDMRNLPVGTQVFAG